MCTYEHFKTEQLVWSLLSSALLGMLLLVTFTDINQKDSFDTEFIITDEIKQLTYISEPQNVCVCVYVYV